MFESSSLGSLSSPHHSDAQKKQEQFILFRLAPDTKVMLPIAGVSEVLTIPLGQIIAIPHLPRWVMGAYNWRGEILWMIDLGDLVGFTPWYQQGVSASAYKAVVLHGDAASKAGGKVIGMVVNAVDDIEWCNPDEIQSPPASAITAELAPFLQGYWLKSDGEIVITLKGEVIMAAMPGSETN